MSTRQHSEVPSDDDLDSWKAIAGFLDRDIKTVRRWEREEGLPVTRHVHSSRGTVSASRAAILAWQKTRQRVPKVEPLRRRRVRGWKIAIGVVLVVITIVAARRYMIPASERPAGPVPRTGRILASLTSEGAAGRLVKVEGSPHSVALSSRRRELYVSHAAHRQIAIIGLDDFSAIGRVPLDRAPGKSLLSPDERRLLIANEGDGVFVLETESRAVRRIRTGGTVRDLAFAPDGRSAYLAMGFGGLKRLSTEDWGLENIPGLICPSSLALDPSGALLYVGSRCGGSGSTMGHDSIDAVDTATRRILSTATGPPIVAGMMALDPSATHLWIDGDDACSSPNYDRLGCPESPAGVMHVLRVSGPKQFVRSLALPAKGGSQAYFTPDGSRVLIQSHPEVLVVDPVSFQVLERGRLGLLNFAFSKDGSVIYATSWDRNTVHEIKPQLDLCPGSRDGLARHWAGDGTGADRLGMGPVNQDRLSYEPGRVGAAFSFRPGGGQPMQFDSGRGRSALLDESSTWAFWYKIRRASPSAMAGQWDDGSSRGWVVGFDAGGNLQARIRASGKDYHIRASAPSGAGAWHHAALASDGGRFRLYSDGRLVSEVPAAADLNTPYPDLRIGGAGGSRPFEGAIDEVSRYSRTLTPTEIGALAGISVGGCPQP